MQLCILQRWDEGVFMNANGNKTAFTEAVLSSYQALLNSVSINGANKNKISKDNYSISNHQTEDQANKQLWAYTFQESNRSHNINDYLKHIA